MAHTLNSWATGVQSSHVIVLTDMGVRNVNNVKHVGFKTASPLPLALLSQPPPLFIVPLPIVAVLSIADTYHLCLISTAEG